MIVFLPAELQIQQGMKTLNNCFLPYQSEKYNIRCLIKKTNNFNNLF